ncbi:hypothetical protein LWI29_005181 [Acer saccharum]|uniref:MULE transposase domain-containing protein n=1 Tax=Acer saccharum TaxID=4024 RepID=A0AA39RJX8_ACESA|nr:hypothetical protein LWI29_005181 [Acer saccharum]
MSKGRPKVAEGYGTAHSSFLLFIRTNHMLKPKNHDVQSRPFSKAQISSLSREKGRPQMLVICIGATHLKARIMGVLLVAVCKDGNKMIYPLAFGFANSECTKSWTWFLKKLHKVIQNPDRVMLVSDFHNVIFNAMEAIFPGAAHGVCAYHLVQNLKRFCKQRNDVIWLYYRATYAYRIEDFDRAMGELKETYRKGLGALFNDNGDGDGDEDDEDLASPSSLCVTVFLGLRFAHRPEQQRLTSFFWDFNEDQSSNDSLSLFLGLGLQFAHKQSKNNSSFS